jgi:Protein of unknown function (DUF3467)
LPDAGVQIEARYSNHFEIGQNAFEFLLQFGQVYNGPETPALVHSRIILSPFSAKRFVDLLLDSVHRYEAKHGAIPNEEP